MIAHSTFLKCLDEGGKAAAWLLIRTISLFLAVPEWLLVSFRTDHGHINHSIVCNLPSVTLRTAAHAGTVTVAFAVVNCFIQDMLFVVA